MINWFDMPAEGLSNGGLFEVKELEVTENGTYEEKGEMYNKVTVNVEGGSGSSDFSTAEITVVNNISDTGENVYSDVPTLTTEDGVTFMSSHNFRIYNGESKTFTLVLYKGHSYFDLVYSGGTHMIHVDHEGNVNVNGTFLDVYGDCTITIIREGKPK